MGGTEVWEDMRVRLMGLTLRQLKQIARDEGICLGYAASRKDSCVGEIVSQRRQRCRERGIDPSACEWEMGAES